MLRELFAGMLFMSLPASAADTEVAKTIIAMERAMLDRSDRGDMTGGLEISAPDIVYQDPFNDKPLIGIAALTAYYASIPAQPGKPGQMSNATVQVMDDVAVLSFNYVSHIGMHRFWNTTEVYRKTAAGWRIVNTHWALTKTEPLKE